MKWTLGLSNGYGGLLRKAMANPILHSICWGGAGLAAVVLWSYESEECARQNINEQSDAGDIFGALLLRCYGVSAGVYSVKGHL